MQIGLVGLGKMGGNMAERLLRSGHQLIVSNRSPGPVTRAVSLGAIGVGNLKDVVGKLSGRKAIWLMIPSGDPVEAALLELSSLLKPNDIVIDGGNSNYKDSIRRGDVLRGQGIHFIDSGTSGGIWGLANGYCLMVGGDSEPISFVEPVFRSLAADGGYLHVGPIGSGHFVKMVHNGIEYAMMQAYAEGFEIMKEGPFKHLDLAAISGLWMHSSVVRSWLLELAESALKKDPELADLKAYVEDSGEGRWTVETAIEHSVPAPTIASALFARFASRHDNAFGLRLIAALRNEFGGHAIKKQD